MNKQEFMEMHDEFASLVYNYELFMKNGFLTDCKYNVSFYDELRKVRNAEAELQVITSAMRDKGNKKIEEILNSIDKAKKAYAQELVSTENKNNYCKQLTSILDKFDQSAFDASEKHFKDFIFKYHPVVCLNAKKEARDVYEMLKKFYFECNYLGFQEYLEINKAVFEVDEITEDRYVEASQVYFKFRQTINQSFINFKDKYPYNKKELFNDEMTVLSERDNLSIKAKQLNEALKAARKDFKEAFGFELKLVD